jgi:WD40 repeat protein
MGDTLATSGKDNLVKLWNVNDLNDVKTLNLGNTNCCALAYSPDSELLMACTTNNKASLYAVRNGYKVAASMNAHSDSITSTNFLLANKQVATTSLDSHIRFWDITTGSKSKDLNTKSKCYDMSIFRSERNFATGHKDSIKIWGTTEKKPLFDLDKAHSSPVSCVRVTQDENYVVSTSTDNTLKIWDLR